MTKEQEMFWRELRYIQNEITSIYSMKAQKYDEVQDLLDDVTYEAIYSIMELFDGLRSKYFRGDIIFVPTGDNVNTIHHTLHDVCPDYLKFSDVV